MNTDLEKIKERYTKLCHEKWENFRIRGSYEFIEPEKINFL